MGKAEKEKARASVPEAEQPYQIPDNWQWVRLGAVCSHISDGSHNPPIDAGKGIPLLSAMNIHDRIIDIDGTTRWITEKEWKLENQRTRIEVGDVLITIVGSIGRVAVVETNERFALQRSVAALKPTINPGYLSYYLESPFVQLFLIENAKGTAQKGFYLKHLEKLACCVSPVSEQQRIVDRIESMFSKLDKAKENVMSVSGYNDTRNTTIGIIDAMKRSILARAFRGELGTNRPEEERASLE